MTVYNVTKLIDYKTIQTIKTYLNVNKIIITFSDCFLDFGLYIKESYDQKKKERCIKYLIKKYNLMQCKISTLIKFPIINKKKERSKPCIKQ